MALKRFAPPAFAADFEGIPNQFEAWSDMIAQAFDMAINSIERPPEDAPRNGPGVGAGRSQYYNALTTETQTPVLDLPISWRGFPRTLAIEHGDAAALMEAERLQPLSEHPAFAGPHQANLDGLLYRPQDEYCEWHVTRNDQGKITRVVFTSEAPEYWSALGSGYPSSLYFDGQRRFDAKGDPTRVLALYQQLVSRDVRMEDLFFQDSSRLPYFAKGDYNPYNKWNTTDGIVHLTHPSNTLLAEIQLGADATILRHRQGRLIVDADELIAAGAFGGMNRSSDPNIGFSINQLARLGVRLTICDPVGLYISTLDTVGWSKPDGVSPVGNYWTIVRGRQGQILRAIYEVPPSEGFTVGDVLIGGQPIRYPGQLAEHITVTLTGRIFMPQPARGANPPLSWYAEAVRRKRTPDFLAKRVHDQPMPDGYEPATVGVGVVVPSPGTEHSALSSELRASVRENRGILKLGRQHPISSEAQQKP